VKVHEAGKNEEARGVEHLRALRGELRAHPGYDAVREEKVDHGVASRGRIHDAAAPDEERSRHGSRSPSHGRLARRR
jgi:hypothetical protein